MAGLYIHIPFCRHKCHYCNFFSVASSKYKDAFFDALHEEIYLQRHYLQNETVRTIYLGGGTPSFVNPAQIRNILETVHKYYPLDPNPEITLEANPEDINPGSLEEFRSIGINRLSIGIQSFFDNDLKYLNRTHSGDAGYLSVVQAKEAGFENISLDLIYGVPTLTNEHWEENLKQAFSLDIPHISAYSLTVEEKTGLDVLIRKKILTPPKEDHIIEHFHILLKKMRDQQYLHYEISNFCRDGWFSKHNSMYWTGEHYLGLGPSAHSYNGTTRQWNVSSILQYVDQINRGDRFYKGEDLTEIQHFNERVMVTLRTMWGCDVNRIREDFGEEMASGLGLRAAEYLKNGLLREKEGIYYLTDEGKLFADQIAADLFLEAEDRSQG